ncbi:MAG: hypothetical protein ACXAC8_17685 [Candidatus Hodarchaeales archaeon]|jgi:hypothetical protein
MSKKLLIKIGLFSLTAFLVISAFQSNQNPIISVIATGYDTDGNLLAAEFVSQTDDSSGIGDVFVFKRSALDMTGLSVRYEQEKDSFAWATEGIEMSFNRIWIQWITFELPTKEINVQVKLYTEIWDKTENETHIRVEKDIWIDQKTTIMAKGYLYFTLPISENVREVEIQRFYVVNENVTVWDDMVYRLQHKTLASIVPRIYLPTEVLMSNGLAVVASITTGGLGAFYQGTKTLKKSIYPPKKWEGFLWISGFLVILIVANIERIMALMVEFPLFYLITAIFTFIVIFFLGNYLTILRFRKKPHYIGIQQPIVNSQTEYFGLKTISGYVYNYINSFGYIREGWIPAKRLEDSDEHKRRMKGKHREIHVHLIRHDAEGKESRVKEWGLIADDPGKTYTKIRIAKNIQEPYRKEIKNRKPRMKKITTPEGDVKEVIAKNWRGREIFDVEIEIEEQEHLIVEAAPKGFKDTYQMLLDLEKNAEMSKRYNKEIERLVKKNTELERKLHIDKAIEAGAESMTAFISIMETFSQSDLQKALADKTKDLMEVNILKKPTYEDIVKKLEGEDEDELKKATTDKKQNKSISTS